jgi:riboflavin synthase
MFTGLVETLGTVRERTPQGAGCELLLSVPPFAGKLTWGESIAVNGCCLSIAAYVGDTCRFQLSPETLRRTNLGGLGVGDRVNLERSLRLGDRIGGHLVQGHIDGVGTVTQRLYEGEWVTMWFECPEALTAQMAPKGSVAVDGVSLTLVEVTRHGFSVALIPQTLAVTTLGFRDIGDPVNLETDLLAKYVSAALQAQQPR